MFSKFIKHIKLRRMCRMHGYNCPECIFRDFIFEGSIFRGNRCRYARLLMDKEARDDK